MFLKESWYVFGWERDLDQAGGILGRVIIGEPVVIWRTAGGELRAMADRCPHRHAPLSRGRVEGDSIRYICYQDHAESRLKGELRRLLARPLKDDPATAGTTQRLISFYQSLFCAERPPWILPAWVKPRARFFYASHFGVPAGPPPVPPPEL